MTIQGRGVVIPAAIGGLTFWAAALRLMPLHAYQRGWRTGYREHGEAGS